MTEDSPAGKRQKLITNYFASDFDVESVRKENEALKQEVAQLKSEVSRLNTKLGESVVVWKLCTTHQRNRRAVDCSRSEIGYRCPLQPPSRATYRDLNPDVLNIIFSYLYHRDTLRCRRVCKAWNALLNFDLHRAAGAGQLETVKKLIDERANVNAPLLPNHPCMSPLYYAAVARTPQHIEIGKLLLESGARVNPEEKPYFNLTPLHQAARGDSDSAEGFMQMLIEAGADIEASRPMWDIDSPIFTAVRSKNFVAKMKILIEAGANVHARDQDGNTPLHTLAKRAVVWAVKAERIAEKKRWDDFNREEGDWTPKNETLNYIADHLAGMDLLVAGGADKNDKNKYGKNPMEYIKWGLDCGDYGHYDEYRYCDDYGCNSNARKRVIAKIKQHLGYPMND